MPTYQYACTACDERLEAVQSFTDAPLTQCPACGGTLRKVFSAVGVVFKGSGFYKTDSRSGAKGGSSSSDGAAGSGEGSGAPASAGAGGSSTPASGSGASGAGTSGSGGSGSSGSGASTGGAAPAAAASKSA